MICCYCCLVATLTFLRTPWTVSSTRLPSPWDFLGKNAGVGGHSLLQGIFLPQGSNLCVLHWQVDSLPLSRQGSPVNEWTWLNILWQSSALTVPTTVFLIWCLFHLMLSVKISRGCKSRCCLIFSLRRLSKSNFPASRRQIWHYQVLVCHFASSEVSLQSEGASELLINSIFTMNFS